MSWKRGNTDGNETDDENIDEDVLLGEDYGDGFLDEDNEEDHASLLDEDDDEHGRMFDNQQFHSNDREEIDHDNETETADDDALLTDEHDGGELEDEEGDMIDEESRQVIASTLDTQVNEDEYEEFTETTNETDKQRGGPKIPAAYTGNSQTPKLHQPSSASFGYNNRISNNSPRFTQQSNLRMNNLQKGTGNIQRPQRNNFLPPSQSPRFGGPPFPMNPSSQYQSTANMFMHGLQWNHAPKQFNIPANFQAHGLPMMPLMSVRPRPMPKLMPIPPKQHPYNDYTPRSNLDRVYNNSSGLSQIARGGRSTNIAMHARNSPRFNNQFDIVQKPLPAKSVSQNYQRARPIDDPKVTNVSDKFKTKQQNAPLSIASRPFLEKNEKQNMDIKDGVRANELRIEYNHGFHTDGGVQEQVRKRHSMERNQANKDVPAKKTLLPLPIETDYELRLAQQAQERERIRKDKEKRRVELAKSNASASRKVEDVAQSHVATAFVKPLPVSQLPNQHPNAWKKKPTWQSRNKISSITSNLAANPPTRDPQLLNYQNNDETTPASFQAPNGYEQVQNFETSSGNLQQWQEEPIVSTRSQSSIPQQGSQSLHNSDQLLMKNQNMRRSNDPPVQTQGNQRRQPQVYHNIPQTQPKAQMISHCGPQAQKGSPQIHQGGLHMQQGGPQIHQGGPQIQQSGPQIHQGGPQIQQSGPQIHQGGPQIQQGGPQIHQGGPPMQQDGPQMHQGGPLLQGGPQIQHNVAQTRQNVSQVQQNLPMMNNTMSNMRQNSQHMQWDGLQTKQGRPQNPQDELQIEHSGLQIQHVQQIHQGGLQMPHGGSQMKQGGPQMRQGGLPTQRGGPQIQGGLRMQQGGPQVKEGGLQMQQGGPQVQQGGLQMQQGRLHMQQGGLQVQQGGPQLQQGETQMQQGGPQMQQKELQLNQVVPQTQQGGIHIQKGRPQMQHNISPMQVPLQIESQFVNVPRSAELDYNAPQSLPNSYQPQQTSRHPNMQALVALAPTSQQTSYQFQSGTDQLSKQITPIDVSTASMHQNYSQLHQQDTQTSQKGIKLNQHYEVPQQEHQQLAHTQPYAVENLSSTRLQQQVESQRFNRQAASKNIKSSTGKPRVHPLDMLSRDAELMTAKKLQQRHYQQEGSGDMQEFVDDSPGDYSKYSTTSHGDIDVAPSVPAHINPRLFKKVTASGNMSDGEVPNRVVVKRSTLNERFQKQASDSQLKVKRPNTAVTEQKSKIADNRLTSPPHPRRQLAQRMSVTTKDRPIKRTVGLRLTSPAPTDQTVPAPATASKVIATKGTPGEKLCCKVMNIDRSTPVSMVRELGERVGVVSKVGRLKRNPDMIVIIFPEESHAVAFRRQFNNAEFLNTRIKVEFISSKK